MLTLPPPSRWSPPPLGLEPDRPTDKLQRLVAIAPRFVEEARSAIERARAAAAAAERRYLETQREPPAGGVGDYGPLHRRLRGSVQIVDAADPDNPKLTIRRAHVVDPLARMVAQGVLRPRHLAAAELLRLLVERAGEGSSSPITRLGMPPGFLGSASTALPTGVAARAHVALGRAWQATWPFHGVVAWVALQRHTLDAFALSRRVRREACAPWLKLGLTALADHFGCD